MTVRVVEMICRVAKCIHLQLAEEILGKFLQNPIHDQAAFDPALGMEDEDNFGDVGIVQFLLHNPIANPGITSGVIQVTLDEAFNDVKDEPIRFVVDSDDGTAEGEGQAIEGILEPVLTVENASAGHSNAEFPGETNPTATPFTKIHSSWACSGNGAAYFLSDAYIVERPLLSREQKERFTRRNAPTATTTVQIEEKIASGKQMRNNACRTTRTVWMKMHRRFSGVGASSLRSPESWGRKGSPSHGSAQNKRKKWYAS